MTGLPPTMRAWVARAYGGPEVLELCEMPAPRPGAGDVLVRVEATSVSAGDRRIRALDMPKGMGWLGRVALGLRRPRRPVLGAELTGIVAAVGDKVTRFQPGDAVIAFQGMRMGAHADYCLVSEAGLIVPRPACMPLEMAAALGFGGTTARDFLRRANAARGERMLVIGASGTVGSALVQLAVLDGLHVDAVTSTGNVDLVRGLGAATVIDYRQQDVIQTGTRYDIVADAVGTLNFGRAMPILAEGGRYLSIAGDLGDMIAGRKGSRRCIAGPAAERADDLATLVQLVEQGGFKPLIDNVVAFTDLPAAHARVDSGRKRGSVVVRLG